MNENAITLAANILAPIGVVWNRWLEPKHITQWNFASDDWHRPSASNDVRVGGHCKTRMEAKDQSFGFDLDYVYDEVEGHKILTDFMSCKCLDKKSIYTLVYYFSNKLHATTVTTCTLYSRTRIKPLE